MFKNLFNLIKNSIFLNGKESSTRITSFFILAVIIGIGATAIGIEITSAIICFIHGTKYAISNELIIMLGAYLSQQLALLGITKSYETKESIKQIEHKTAVATLSNGQNNSAPSPTPDANNQNVSTQS